MKKTNANEDSLTFHIRITKKCNANCVYCSSFQNNVNDIMSLEDLEKSLSFITNLITQYGLGGKRDTVTVQYVGGEVSVIPMAYLEQFTSMVEEKISPLFKHFHHGVQTNLIASKNKISDLVDIFGKNIGTSIDNFTDQRMIGTSASKYKTIFLQNQTYTKKLIGRNIPGVIVIDNKMKPHIHEEIKIAESKKMSLMLRTVFQGGMPVENFSSEYLTPLYSTIFDNWFMKSNIIIDPHYSLLSKRLLAHDKDIKNLTYLTGCPFQSNCATSSINLESDGSLYLCFEMADAEHYSLGNAIKGEFKEDVFNLLLSRTEKLSTDCKECDYYNECQGGCMNEAIEQKNDLFAKTEYCHTWKSLFAKIDNGIENYGYKEVKDWMEKLI